MKFWPVLYLKLLYLDFFDVQYDKYKPYDEQWGSNHRNQILRNLPAAQVRSIHHIRVHLPLAERYLAN